MKRLIQLLCALWLVLPQVGLAANFDPALQAALRTGPSELPVIVRLKARADTASLAAAIADRRQLHTAIIHRLRKVASDSQAPLQSLLAARGVGKVESLVLINALAFRASPELIAEVAARPEVASVGLDGGVPPPSLPPPVPLATSVVPSATTLWNLSAISAPALWNSGFHGEGVVVATLDTGVDVNHQELAGNYLDNGHSWFDPYTGSTTPYDFAGDLGLYHGTAVMSVLVGANIGVAPGAKWIAAKIFPDTGNAAYSAIHSAFDWVLDPDRDPATDDAPDVVNNSWSLDSSSVDQCIDEFATDVERLRDAGIAVVFAGGNYGSNSQPHTSVSPGNNAGNLAAGMVDSALDIDPQSSQGPSPCDPAGTVYPDLVAPGVDIHVADGTSSTA